MLPFVADLPPLEQERIMCSISAALKYQVPANIVLAVAEHAHAALTSFIRSEHEAGHRLVLVITGKGRSEADAMTARRHGILRHSVPHWLAAPPLVTRVLEVVPAHPTHGGAGALYVYLRRRR